MSCSFTSDKSINENNNNNDNHGEQVNDVIDKELEIKNESIHSPSSGFPASGSASAEVAILVDKIKTNLDQDSRSQRQEDVQKKCENPEIILDAIDEWNTQFQLLVNGNKSMKDALEHLLEERETLLRDNKKVTEDIAKFHENIKNSHLQLSRLNELDEENENLKTSNSNLQNRIEKLQQEQGKIENETKEKIGYLEECHKKEIGSLTNNLTSNAENEKKVLQQKINQYKKQALELEMQNNQIQAAKETELTHLSMEYENKLAKFQRQKIQNQQNQMNSSNQEIFRKKLQHMQEEHEKEIQSLKQTIETSQFSNRPSPRSRERLTLTTFSGKKRKERI